MYCTVKILSEDVYYFIINNYISKIIRLLTFQVPSPKIGYLFPLLNVTDSI